MNKSRDNRCSYSQWRREVKKKNSYCLDIDFVEYMMVNDVRVPYALLEVNEPAMPLDSCNWFKNVHTCKKEQVALLKEFSKRMKLPWFVVLFKVEDGIPKFKVYNDKRQSENIYSEEEFLAILEECKKDAQNNIKKN